MAITDIKYDKKKYGLTDSGKIQCQKAGKELIENMDDRSWF